jgi:hypothetical protein
LSGDSGLLEYDCITLKTKRPAAVYTRRSDAARHSPFFEGAAISKVGYNLRLPQPRVHITPRCPEPNGSPASVAVAIGENRACTRTDTKSVDWPEPVCGQPCCHDGRKDEDRPEPESRQGLAIIEHDWILSPIKVRWRTISRQNWDSAENARNRDRLTLGEFAWPYTCRILRYSCRFLRFSWPLVRVPKSEIWKPNSNS